MLYDVLFQYVLYVFWYFYFIKSNEPLRTIITYILECWKTFKNFGNNNATIEKLYQQFHVQ